MNFCHICVNQSERVQQKYNNRYYLGWRCAKCKSALFDVPVPNQPTPWKNILEVKDINSRVMKGVERLSRQ
jgi:hypothetical protein